MMIVILFFSPFSVFHEWWFLSNLLIVFFFPPIVSDIRLPYRLLKIMMLGGYKRRDGGGKLHHSLTVMHHIPTVSGGQLL